MTFLKNSTLPQGPEQQSDISTLRQSDDEIRTSSEAVREKTRNILGFNIEALKIYRILSPQEKSYFLKKYNDEDIDREDEELLNIYYDIKSHKEVYDSLMENITEEQHVMDLDREQRYEYLSLEKDFSIASGAVHPEIIISLADGKKFLQDRLSTISKYFSTQDFEELYRKGLNNVYATVKNSIHKNQTEFYQDPSDSSDNILNNSTINGFGITDTGNLDKKDLPNKEFIIKEYQNCILETCAHALRISGFHKVSMSIKSVLKGRNTVDTPKDKVRDKVHAILYNM